jgi:hypothetical protein
MTLHARRDVDYVSVAGGCGAAHTRPVTHGARSAHWELICPRCEAVLIKTHDPHWAVTRAEVPETPDEATAREHLEKRGARDRETVITAALAKLAGIADSSSNGGQVDAVVCRRGHRNLPQSRFCGECGMLLSDVEPVTEPLSHPASPSQPGLRHTADELRKLPVAELRHLAEEAGINPKQSKRDLVDALS